MTPKTMSPGVVDPSLLGDEAQRSGADAAVLILDASARAAEYENPLTAAELARGLAYLRRHHGWTTAEVAAARDLIQNA